MGLDLGIRSGKSAAAMTRDLRQYLQHPDKLFRRVRDEHGLLKLSQAAKDFHPGRGVYRSSYMNARRLAATETNIAYRTADHLRWQKMDFVVGIEIVLSNNHTIRLQPGEKTSDLPGQMRADGTPKANAVRTLTDICDTLAGRYPKDFKFTGWHPHCRCRAVTILKTEEEMARDTKRIIDGRQPSADSANAVTDTPEAFKNWVEDNRDRIANGHSLPYFIRDNAKYTGIRMSRYNGVGAVTGTKLGRTATRAAFKVYENMPAATLTDEVMQNTEEIAKEFGIKTPPKPMTFLEANEGRGNVNYGKGAEYSDNCQCCVAVHEARLRGLNLTAVGYSARKGSITFQLGENFQNIWVNPKTGKTPQLTILKADSDEALYAKLERELSAKGRYHIGINLTANRGHVITAEKFSNGKLLFYDPQSGDFLNIREYTSLESIEVLKVDKLLFDANILKKISKIIQ